MKSLALLLTAFLFFFISCKDKERGPLVVSDTTPGMLSDIKVENLPGGAKITYSLPDDPEILYVLAEFSSHENETRVVKSSVYKNFVLLDGFVSTAKREVKLYAVNRSERESQPSLVEIEPLTPPIHDVFVSLKVEKDFGGVHLSFHNEAKNDYALHTLIKDSTGAWVTYDRLYTSAEDREYSIHGLPAIPTDFGFFFVDEWQNHSDTLLKTLTPLYEEELDKSLWKLYPLDNDTYQPLYSRPIDRLWDGSVSTSPYAIDPVGATLPQWLTIDLGQAAVLSRIRFNEYYKSSDTKWLFAKGSPKEYEIWGSNNPSDDGDWSSWTLLGYIESVKPSGLPAGAALTNEDLAAGIEGDNFSFSYTGVAYRYIRFKTINTWASRADVFFGEITFWGQPQ